MIRPLFDENNKMVNPTIVLCNRNKHKIGSIFPITDWEITPDIYGKNECSFKVYKLNNGEKLKYWDQIINLKLIYIPEYDEYFEIEVNEQESNENIKTIVGNNLGIAELSQTMLYDLEINTEEDIKRTDYEIAYFYNIENPNTSILGRVLSKAPHYKIKHVDSTLCNIVRQFSINDKSIYDFLTNDLSEEINCLVKADSDRTISVYDLYDCCLDCGERSNYIEVCEKCGSTNIKKGYGINTTAFVSTSNLATMITNDPDKDSIKNTFRVQGRDDLINAAVRACNPNGTEYINRFSEETLNDMSDILRSSLESYQDLFNSKTEAYQDCMLKIYDTMDKILYLTSEMMPSPSLDEYTASSELLLLSSNNLSPVSVQSLKYSGKTTVDNAVKGMFPIYLHSGFSAEIIESTYETGSTVWKGRFRVTDELIVDDNDPDKYAETPIGVFITVNIDEDYSNFIKQKLEKLLSKESLVEIQDIESDDDFKKELKLYCKNRLSSFSDAYQSCLEVLAGIGAGNSEHEFYDPVYMQYYKRKEYIDEEIIVRESEITEQEKIQEEQIKIRDDIQSELNLQSYLENKQIGLYNEYCSYRREDTYKNDNYISDGLSNLELLQKANELLKVANDEIYKASETQYSITTTIGNLFANKDFNAIHNVFMPGNWIKVDIDNQIYKLRLINYTIRDNDISELPCELSNVTKIKSGISDIADVISSAKSMASSYESVKHQVKNNEENTKPVQNWITDGLDTTLVSIKNAENQTVVYDKHGVLCREYDEITESYLPEQLKIVNNMIAITDDNWKTVKTALGKYYYTDPETQEVKTAYGLLAETVVGRFILGELLKIVNDNGTLSFDDNGLIVTNGTNTFTLNPNEAEGKIISLSNQSEDILYVDTNGNAVFRGTIYANDGVFTGKIHAKSGTFSGDITSTATIKGGRIEGSEISGTTITTPNFKVSVNGDVEINGNLTSNNAIKLSCYGNENNIIEGDVYAEANTLNLRGLDNEIFLSYVGKYSGGGELETIVARKSSYFQRDLTVAGTKNRIIETSSYNNRLQYCYETPTPMFGDIGEGILDESGICYIYLDDIFAETIDLDCKYQVFLQAYGDGKCYVSERNNNYFIVNGTPNMSFGWELKAVQKGYDTIRLEEFMKNDDNLSDNSIDLTLSYVEELVNDYELEDLI